MSSRYYETEKNGDEIKPGRISAELRAALNIAENDLPIWIYRMRALGYPPGWLNKAIVDTSDIFDTDSAAAATKTTNDNINSNKRKNLPEDTIQYDHSKLIEYPGFNGPPPPNTVDYHYYYNMPPMLEHQQLEYARKHMNAFEPAPLPKRTRTSSSHDHSSSSTNNNCGGPASPDNDDGDESGNDSSGSEQEEGNEDKDTSKQANKSNLSSSLAEEIKLVSKGSPMPKPVNRLPLEKFSEGVVGELLYFENTPNSSGKFDSIRGLLSTIRQSKSETSLVEASPKATEESSDEIG